MVSLVKGLAASLYAVVHSVPYQYRITNRIESIRIANWNALVCGWWHGTVVERRSLTGELSPSCARPAADG